MRVAIAQQGLLQIAKLIEVNQRVRAVSLLERMGKLLLFMLNVLDAGKLEFIKSILIIMLTNQGGQALLY